MLIWGEQPMAWTAGLAALTIHLSPDTSKYDKINGKTTSYGLDTLGQK